MKNLAFLMALAIAMGPVSARAKDSRAQTLRTRAAETRKPPRDDVSISKSEAIKRARARFGGEAISARLVVESGKKVYRIKLHSEGKIRVVLVDAVTGSVWEE